MKSHQNLLLNFPIRCSRGFSLIEVVLAIGIFLVTVLALVGLLGPTLQSVDEVEKTDEVASVVNTVNAFLQSSPDIAPTGSGNSKFQAIYAAVKAGDEATIFVYRYFSDDPSSSNPAVKLEVGFASGEPVGDSAKVNEPGSNPADFSQAAGSIYRVVLSASSVTPADHRSDTRNPNGIYTLSKDDHLAYPEGYLAMEVRIFAESPPAPGESFSEATNLSDLNSIEPIFTYNTAVVR